MTSTIEDIQACVFDAYGTLFDVHSAAREAFNFLGDQSPALSELWRSKQLQYTWLRGLAGRYADFWQVTGDALDFALATFKLEEVPALRPLLMQSYLTLSAYPEVPATLQRLKTAGMKLAILSNGTPSMLATAAAHAGIDGLLDMVLSVDEVQVYKPHAMVYQLVCDRLHTTPGEICFISSNGWDAHSAKAFGMRVVWCNRFHQPPERIPHTPDAEIASLNELPELIHGQ